MRLLRKKGPGMDFAFPDLCLDEQARYEQLQGPIHPAYEYQIHQAIEEYVNDNLPVGLRWSYDACLLNGNNKIVADSEIVNIDGTQYAICPDAYMALDELAPAAVKAAVKEVFGRATLL